MSLSCSSYQSSNASRCIQLNEQPSISNVKHQRNYLLWWPDRVHITHREHGWHAANNTLRQRQNGLHFADDMFRYMFLNEKLCVLIKTSPKFVPKGPIKNNPKLVYIMAWPWNRDKALSEPVMHGLIHSHIYESLGLNELTWNKITNILQCIFSNAFSYENLILFLYRWHLFINV